MHSGAKVFPTICETHWSKLFRIRESGSKQKSWHSLKVQHWLRSIISPFKNSFDHQLDNKLELFRATFKSDQPNLIQVWADEKFIYKASRRLQPWKGSLINLVGTQWRMVTKAHDLVIFWAIKKLLGRGLSADYRQTFWRLFDLPSFNFLNCEEFAAKKRRLLNAKQEEYNFKGDTA